MRYGDKNEQHIFDSTLPKNFLPIYDVVILDFVYYNMYYILQEEIKNRLYDNNKTESLDICSSFYEKNVYININYF